VPFLLESRKVRVKVGEQLRDIWRQATRRSGQGLDAELAAGAQAERKTLALPAILSPVQFPGRHLPKPTPANFRRFAETPLVRRAINVIKDRIAAMDWQVRVRRGIRTEEVAFLERKLGALRFTLEEPNAADSFRTLIEQVIEDALTGGFGAIEMEATGDPERPAMLWPVDGASIRINANWNGEPDSARYAQVMTGQVESGAGGVARSPADVRPYESSELYPVRTGTAGGGVRDGEPVSQRASLRG
jgi:hypothetical protein